MTKGVYNSQAKKSLYYKRCFSQPGQHLVMSHYVTSVDVTFDTIRKVYTSARPTTCNVTLCPISKNYIFTLQKVYMTARPINYHDTLCHIMSHHECITKPNKLLVMSYYVLSAIVIFVMLQELNIPYRQVPFCVTLHHFNWCNIVHTTRGVYSSYAEFLSCQNMSHQRTKHESSDLISQPSHYLLCHMTSNQLI